MDEAQQFQVTILGEWVEVSWEEDEVFHTATLTPSDTTSVILIALFESLREGAR